MVKVNKWGLGFYVVKKLKGGDLTKIIERHKSIIININFLFHISLLEMFMWFLLTTL
jgi:hypothetical protein